MFHKLIENVIDLEQDIGEDNVKKIIKELESARDLAAQLVKEKANDATRALKRMFSIRAYDPRAKALMEEDELHYWRIIKF